jgi:hypothetical protein
MSEGPWAGDLRESAPDLAGNTCVEIFNGNEWFVAMPIPAGETFKTMSVCLCAPLDATPAEIERWVERARRE